MSTVRVGIGFDIHAFAKKRKLFLGGIEIPSHSGLKGHSDADVLLHAMSDAILGAIGKSDIGSYFPDTDAKHKNISSVFIIKKAIKLMQQEGYALANIDSVIICDEPKISKYSSMMKLKLAQILGIPVGAIGIKGKTTEQLLAFSGKGIAVYSTVLLTRNRP